MSDQKPQLRELTQALQDLTWSEVKHMAIQLEMEYSKLKQIEERNVEMTDRLLSTMNTWLDNDKSATWDKIIKALYDIERNVLANEIERHCQLSQPPLSASRKRKCRNSPTSSTPSPSPQPPQRPKLTTTELPGWQTRVVRETKQEGEMKEPIKLYVLDLCIPNIVPP